MQSPCPVRRHLGGTCKGRGEVLLVDGLMDEPLDRQARWCGDRLPRRHSVVPVAERPNRRSVSTAMAAGPGLREVAAAQSVGEGVRADGRHDDLGRSLINSLHRLGRCDRKDSAGIAAGKSSAVTNPPCLVWLRKGSADPYKREIRQIQRAEAGLTAARFVGPPGRPPVGGPGSGS